MRWLQNPLISPENQPPKRPDVGYILQCLSLRPLARGLRSTILGDDCISKLEAAVFENRDSGSEEEESLPSVSSGY